jgi:hypothetical protein
VRSLGVKSPAWMAVDVTLSGQLKPSAFPKPGSRLMPPRPKPTTIRTARMLAGKCSRSLVSIAVSFRFPLIHSLWRVYCGYFSHSSSVRSTVEEYLNKAFRRKREKNYFRRFLLLPRRHRQLRFGCRICRILMCPTSISFTSLLVQC